MHLFCGALGLSPRFWRKSTPAPLGHSFPTPRFAVANNWEWHLPAPLQFLPLPIRHHKGSCCEWGAPPVVQSAIGREINTRAIIFLHFKQKNRGVLWIGRTDSELLQPIEARSSSQCRKEAQSPQPGADRCDEAQPYQGTQHCREGGAFDFDSTGETCPCVTSGAASLVAPL